MKTDPGGQGGKVTFVATTSSRRALLRSPVSDLPCVHWRLRIVEQAAASLRLVHEIASTDEFDLTRPGAVRMRVVPETARIEAHSVLHRPGSPGAIAVGRQFGFSGLLSVEEITLRADEEVVADGVVEGEAGRVLAPFRGVEGNVELLAATLRLPARAVLAPVLLPWALGTAAALLGGVAVATWVAWRFDLVPHGQHVQDISDGKLTLPAEVGPHRHTRRHFSQPD